MHPTAARRFAPGSSFPRRRGDAPLPAAFRFSSAQFPPQARGCTWRSRQRLAVARVSPAGAGMHPARRALPARRAGFPRRRGDAPRREPRNRLEEAFPPQARGCTCAVDNPEARCQVSPAGAGMHPHPPTTRPCASCFPRRRGDAPPCDDAPLLRTRFPPQARGCTLLNRAPERVHLVSPAGAGMHPGAPRVRPAWPRFPRRRGDAPRGTDGEAEGRTFPPQARGCTPDDPHPHRRRDVSPAGAGMHLYRTTPRSASISFPRRRGDAP